MRTLAVEASQEKRRISRYKVTAADPELKVSSVLLLQLQVLCEEILLFEAMVKRKPMDNKI